MDGGILSGNRNLKSSMIQPIKTISRLQESNSFRKMPVILGGQKDPETEKKTAINHGMLVASICSEAFVQIKTGGQDLIVCIDSPFWKSRLVNRHYNLIQIFSGNMMGEFIICEYEGYFTAKSQHIVSVGNYRRPLNPGDFVVKIGNVLKFEEQS